MNRQMGNYLFAMVEHYICHIHILVYILDTYTDYNTAFLCATLVTDHCCFSCMILTITPEWVTTAPKWVSTHEQTPKWVNLTNFEQVVITVPEWVMCITAPKWVIMFAQQQVNVTTHEWVNSEKVYMATP